VVLAVGICSVEDLREELEARGVELMTDEWSELAVQRMDIYTAEHMGAAEEAVEAVYPPPLRTLAVSLCAS
jgi:hypothetical protein